MKQQAQRYVRSRPWCRRNECDGPSNKSLGRSDYMYISASRLSSPYDVTPRPLCSSRLTRNENGYTSYLDRIEMYDVSSWLSSFAASSFMYKIRKTTETARTREDHLTWCADAYTENTIKGSIRKAKRPIPMP